MARTGTSKRIVCSQGPSTSTQSWPSGSTLTLTNLRGWSLLHSLSPARLFPNTFSGFHHK
jgi:hypothetical protein